MAGYFYMAAYSLDLFMVRERPVDFSAKVANCMNVETNLSESDRGWAYFSAGSVVNGCNPCIQSCLFGPVEETSWSRIKTFSR